MQTYRADIDGLRALAVVSVVLFHLGYPWLPGGFIGVDIFFVISGFLITGILVREVQTTGKVDFARFYLRRLRRLFPALFVTSLLTMIFGAMILPPEYMQSLGGSVVAALASVSNLFFWTQSGYFDVSNSMKPLLHTWSLSVEEQFYLIWPLIMLVAVRAFQRQWVFVVAMVAAASFIANLFYQSDQSLIFYWLPFRAFELAIGGILVWVVDRWKAVGLAADIFFWVGLGLIAWSLLSISEDDVFPSYNALFPCMGSALIILGGHHAKARILLANRLAAGVGKVSYSLYLVHWPVIVLVPYWLSAQIDGVMRLMMTGLMIAASLALYFFVEQPLRRPKEGTIVSGNKAYVIASLAGAVVLAIPCYNAWASHGWMWRYTPEVISMMEENNLHLPGENPLNGCLKSKDQGRQDIPASCYTPDLEDPRPTILLVGDSTATHLVVGMREILGQQYQIKTWASSSCAPLAHWSFPTEGRCDENNHEFYQRLIHEFDYDLIVLSAFNAATGFSEDLAMSTAVLREAGLDYVLVGQMPTYADRPIHLAARFGTGDLTAAMKANMVDSCAGEDGIDQLIEPSRFFSAKMAMCNGDTPIYQKDGRLLQVDTLHLSDFGSVFMVEKFAAWARLNGHL